ncbi:MAG: Rab family GTPase [Candidatus Heimdallarchaeaceae archaeon]
MKKTQIIKKIVLIGDAGVGKTSIVRRFVTGLFNPAYIITLGTTIMKKEVEYLDMITNLAIWDIGGQSVFKAVRSKYYFAAEGALAICDRCDRKTFENLSSWIDSFHEVVGEKPIIVVGNKSDLHDLVVSEKDLDELASQYKSSEYLLTSAKEGFNVEKAFLNLTRLMLAKEDVWP